MPKTAEQKEAEKRFFLVNIRFEDDLVDVVHRYDVIWNPRHPDYRKANKDEIFEEVVFDLKAYGYNVSPGFTKVHWEELFEKYVRKRRDIPPVDGEEEKDRIIKRWPLFLKMDYLYDITAPGAALQPQGTINRTALATESVEIPFPSGWEKKQDGLSGKIYYVDHIRKVTQWDDPRLRDPSIWMGQQNRLLQKLTSMFSDAPEQTVREALLKTRFQEYEAIQHLSGLGYKKSSTTSASQGASSMPAPSSASGQRAPSTPACQEKRSAKSQGVASPQSQNRPAANAGPDLFTLLSMKARFPETTDDVLTDVLNQCGQNVDQASRELTNMGYAGRQKAVERTFQMEAKKDDLDKDHQLRLDDDRKRHIGQLKNEFESFLDADISDALDKSNFDLYEARNMLRKREASLRTQQMADIAAADVAASTAAVQIVTVKETPSESIITSTVVAQDRAPSAEQMPTVKENKALVLIKPKEKKDIRIRQPHWHGLHEEHGSKSTGATPTHHVGGRETLARGPNPELRHGSDPNLRSGSNPALRRGPDRDQRTHQVILAAI